GTNSYRVNPHIQLRVSVYPPAPRCCLSKRFQSEDKTCGNHCPSGNPAQHRVSRSLSALQCGTRLHVPDRSSASEPHGRGTHSNQKKTHTSRRYDGSPLFSTSGQFSPPGRRSRQKIVLKCFHGWKERRRPEVEFRLPACQSGWGAAALAPHFDRAPADRDDPLCSATHEPCCSNMLYWTLRGTAPIP